MAAQPIRVIVADDHPLMAQATKQLLEEIEGLQVVDVAHDGKSCLDQVQKHRPDMVFLDYQMPDLVGTDVTEQIKASYPSTHVVIFTGVDVSALIDKFLELQVSGVISKGTRHTTIKHMVACMLDDHIVLPRSTIHHLSPPSKPAELTEELTDDEVTIMSMIVRGATLDQISDHIHMSKRSVDNYQRKIYDKLRVKGRAQAMEAFIRSKYYTDAMRGDSD